MYVIRASFIGILALCAGGAASLTLAQQVTTTPAIRDVRPVGFPPYTASRRIALFAPTPAEYAQAVGDRAFVMERVTYRSDDLDVYAYLYRPVAPPKGKKLPVVVFNRGSYVRDDFSYEVLMLAKRLAHQGYLVIAPMLRGSGGAQGHDEMIPLLLMNGGADSQVSPFHAIQLASALEKLRKRYELKIFYGEEHVSPGRARERDEDAVRWFRRFDEPPSTP